MRKHFLFFVLAAFAILGCDGDSNMPCITCDSPPVSAYCLYFDYNSGSYKCNNMSSSQCYNNNGSAYDNYSDCNYALQQQYVSSAYCLYYDGGSYRCSNMTSSQCYNNNGSAYDNYSDCNYALQQYSTVYCLYYDYNIGSYRCSNMTSSQCYNNNGSAYSDSYDCNYASQQYNVPSSSSLRSSSSSSVVCSISGYGTVNIGNQTWMAKNLNCNVAGSKCYDNTTNCTTYGRLYSWATAMGISEEYNYNWWEGSDVKHRGICPSGWHIPSNEEWSELFRYVDDLSSGYGYGDNNAYDSHTAGRYLKATSGWNGDGNGTGEFGLGFSALPGGYGFDGSFGEVGNGGCWWSASGYDGFNAYYRYMYYNSDAASWNYNSKDVLFSVRCVKN